MANDMAKAADSQSELDMKELCGKFSMETIATCAFGVNAETFSNDDSQFVKNAKGANSYDVRVRNGRGRGSRFPQKVDEATEFV